MDIIDAQSYEEFFNTIYQEEMKQIKGKLSGITGNENSFQYNKYRLDFFSRFLTEHQYFETNLKEKTFLETFKEIFFYLSDWEKSYTTEIEKSDPSAREFRERRNSFRHMTKSFLNNIAGIYYMFNRDNNEVAVYHKYKKHKINLSILESLEVLKTFLIDYSRILIELVNYELNQGMISNSLKELLDNTKPLDRLQYLCAEDWFQLSQRVRIMAHLQPSPILTRVFEKKWGRTKKLRQKSPKNVQEFFVQIIDQKKLIEHNKDLKQQKKTEELSQITEVIKELLAELREGDEIKVNDALAIIVEDIHLEYITSDKLEEYFRNMLIELPDFEYIRLKKTFRRKSSPIIELQSNIDTIFKQTVSSSLQIIEENLEEIQAGQQEILVQTKQIQDFLEDQFEVVIENQGKIEEYLFQKLGSDFEKIKHLWNLYKDKQIKGKEFVQEASKILGNKFSKVFFNIMFFLK